MSYDAVASWIWPVGQAARADRARCESARPATGSCARLLDPIPSPANRARLRARSRVPSARQPRRSANSSRRSSRASSTGPTSPWANFSTSGSRAQSEASVRVRSTRTDARSRPESVRLSGRSGSTNWSQTPWTLRTAGGWTRVSRRPRCTSTTPSSRRRAIRRSSGGGSIGHPRLGPRRRESIGSR